MTGESNNNPENVVPNNTNFSISRESNGLNNHQAARVGVAVTGKSGSTTQQMSQGAAAAGVLDFKAAKVASTTAFAATYSKIKGESFQFLKKLTVS